MHFNFKPTQYTLHNIDIGTCKQETTKGSKVQNVLTNRKNFSKSSKVQKKDACPKSPIECPRM
mgnify:CR=1 FL=1